jgi:hypothetical protein
VSLDAVPSFPDSRESVLKSIVNVVGIADDSPDRADHLIFDRPDKAFVGILLIRHRTSFFDKVLLNIGLINFFIP